MPERRWYRSLYWRIALGYLAMLALVLLVQTSLAVWMAGRLWGKASRTPAQLAEMVALDLEAQIAAAPDLNIGEYLRQRYGRGYQPFAVLVFEREREQFFTNRPGPGMMPPQFGRDARRRMFHQGEPFEHEPPGRRAFAEYAEIQINGRAVGLVAVPKNPPPLEFSLREIAPTLAWVGIGLLGAGTALMAFVIFRPMRGRLRSLEHAARALGEGRSGVRANERGGDEVSALAVTFNKMADDLAASDRVRRQLLADVSHELMTPLSGIRGYVETLEMTELKLDEATRRRYLEVIEEETHKLEAIIGDLLDLARLEGGGDTLDREPVLVDDLFRRVSDRHQPQLRERGVTLTAASAPNTPLVFGDPDRLEQALQNVAANAIRHTPSGGRVELRAQPEGDRVRITVADTGPGIPPEHLPHVFDRFYKADASRAGTVVPSGSGLGLSIVRAIVLRHGGEVRASNTAEGGAAFTFLLPSATTAR